MSSRDRERAAVHCRFTDGTVTMRDGIAVAYRDHGGDGRGLVLLHGGGANLVAMDQYAARLGDGRRVVAMDARCCGQSADPSHFRLVDVAGDVAELAASLELGPVDVVGHSMGGFVAGFYASAHPDARVVSIDGFGPGTVSRGTDADRRAFEGFQATMRDSFYAMTGPPETGDEHWRVRQIDLLCQTLPRVGYTAPNVHELAERNFVHLGDGTFRRHPSRRLFEHVFADDADRDVLRMYRDAVCPTLIIRCSDSGAPPILDDELDELARANTNIEIRRVPLTHLGPAWDALEDVARAIEDFFSRHPVT